MLILFYILLRQFSTDLSGLFCDLMSPVTLKYFLSNVNLVGDIFSRRPLRYLLICCLFFFILCCRYICHLIFHYLLKFIYTVFIVSIH